MKSNNRKVTYRYDAFGRRIISKKNGNKTTLICWGDSECAEYEHRASQDAIQNDIMGHPTRLNSVIARDTEDRENRVDLQWYHKNYLDHVYAVSDDNGNLVEHYRYTAFGEPEIYSATGTKRNTSAIANTVMWNTRRYDADNGLYYYKFRHYAANIGRWLGRDPIGERGGINLYAFVGNMPILYIDINGEWGWIGAAIGAVQGAISGAISGAVQGGVSGAVAGAAGGALGSALQGTAGHVVTAAATAAIVGTSGIIVTVVVDEGLDDLLPDDNDPYPDFDYEPCQ